MKQETNELLKQIRNILIVIAFILLVNVIVTGMNNNVNYSSGNSSGNNTLESINNDTTTEYDVSSFTEVTADEMFTKVNESGYHVIFFGSSNCGYCKAFIPVLQQAQTNFKFKTLYIDMTKVTDADATKIQAISDDVKEGFGYTPLMIIYKDGKYVDMQVGYSDYSSFETFLTGLGMTK